MRLLATTLCLAVVATACDLRSTSTPDASPGAPAEVASSSTAAARRPPALRAASPPPPALPDLPVLAAQAGPAPAPEARLDGNPCHAVWTGSQTAPLACARSLFTGADKGGAVPLVPRTLLSHDVAALPAVVDHRLEGTEGPVRNQSGTPACTAFATAAAIDHALARWGGGNPSVSVMQILVALPLAGGRDLAHLERRADARPRAPVAVQRPRGARLGAVQGVPEAAAPRVAAGRSTRPACAPSSRPSSASSPRSSTWARRPTRRARGEARGRTGRDDHAGAAAGVRAEGPAGSAVHPALHEVGGTRLRPRDGPRRVRALPARHVLPAHNSWGTAWGDGGYAWIHETTLRRWSREVVAVDAEPLLRAPGSRPLRKRAQTTCAAGLVPDSIRATCTPPCPDHSPRHDGVCPVAGQCPAGFVNLTGACVLAAPVGNGSDPQTGISWTCGPGGCSYVLPRASDAACTGAVCQASCPAPDFILAKMGARRVTDLPGDPSCPRRSSESQRRSRTTEPSITPVPRSPPPNPPVGTGEAVTRGW